MLAFACVSVQSLTCSSAKQAYIGASCCDLSTPRDKVLECNRENPEKVNFNNQEMTSNSSTLTLDNLDTSAWRKTTLLNFDQSGGDTVGERNSNMMVTSKYIVWVYGLKAYPYYESQIAVYDRYTLQLVWDKSVESIQADAGETVLFKRSRYTPAITDDEQHIYVTGVDFFQQNHEAALLKIKLDDGTLKKSFEWRPTPDHNAPKGGAAMLLGQKATARGNVFLFEDFNSTHRGILMGSGSGDTYFIHFLQATVPKTNIEDLGNAYMSGLAQFFVEEKATETFSLLWEFKSNPEHLKGWTAPERTNHICVTSYEWDSTSASGWKTTDVTEQTASALSTDSFIATCDLDGNVVDGQYEDITMMVPIFDGIKITDGSSSTAVISTEPQFFVKTNTLVFITPDPNWGTNHVFYGSCDVSFFMRDIWSLAKNQLIITCESPQWMEGSPPAKLRLKTNYPNNYNIPEVEPPSGRWDIEFMDASGVVTQNITGKFIGIQRTYTSGKLASGTIITEQGTSQLQDAFGSIHNIPGKMLIGQQLLKKLPHTLVDQGYKLDAAEASRLSFTGGSFWSPGVTRVGSESVLLPFGNPNSVPLHEALADTGDKIKKDEQEGTVDFVVGVAAETIAGVQVYEYTADVQIDPYSLCTFAGVDGQLIVHSSTSTKVKFFGAINGVAAGAMPMKCTHWYPYAWWSSVDGAGDPDAYNTLNVVEQMYHIQYDKSTKAKRQTIDYAAFAAKKQRMLDWANDRKVECRYSKNGLRALSNSVAKLNIYSGLLEGVAHGAHTKEVWYSRQRYSAYIPGNGFNSLVTDYSPTSGIIDIVGETTSWPLPNEGPGSSQVTNSAALDLFPLGSDGDFSTPPALLAGNKVVAPNKNGVVMKFDADEAVTVRGEKVFRTSFIDGNMEGAGQFVGMINYGFGRSEKTICLGWRNGGEGWAHKMDVNEAKDGVDFESMWGQPFMQIISADPVTGELTEEKKFIELAAPGEPRHPFYPTTFLVQGTEGRDDICVAGDWEGRAYFVNARTKEMKVKQLDSFGGRNAPVLVSNYMYSSGERDDTLMGFSGSVQPAKKSGGETLVAATNLDVNHQKFSHDCFA